MTAPWTVRYAPTVAGARHGTVGHRSVVGGRREKVEEDPSGFVFDAKILDYVISVNLLYLLGRVRHVALNVCSHLE